MPAAISRLPSPPPARQVMINRVQHLDVLEWVWFLNAFGDGFTYKYMFGDKDTFAFAFALAEKANYYSEINTPPAGAPPAGLRGVGCLPGTGAAARLRAVCMAAVLLPLPLLRGKREHGSPVPARSREPRLIPPAF